MSGLKNAITGNHKYPVSKEGCYQFATGKGAKGWKNNLHG
jgi:hypothetical protein